MPPRAGNRPVALPRARRVRMIRHAGTTNRTTGPAVSCTSPTGPTAGAAQRSPRTWPSRPELHPASAWAGSTTPATREPEVGGGGSWGWRVGPRASSDDDSLDHGSSMRLRSAADASVDQVARRPAPVRVAERGRQKRYLAALGSASAARGVPDIHSLPRPQCWQAR
jgi:hypothetical protein